jgi:hypothetical protein
LHVFTPEVQLGLFFLGIVLVGVPHGAADLLVSTQQARDAGRPFHAPGFLLGYVGRLLLFAAVLYFFPVVGSALFILFSAYHFGETDLARLRTETLLGKFVVLNYGLVILGIILLGHAEEVRPILAVLDASPEQALWLERVISSKMLLLGASLVLFFGSAFAYFVLNPSSRVDGGDFIEIHCAANLEVCEQRDTKGLYAKARAGEIQEFTGISSPYEAPEAPELRLDTGSQNLGDSVAQVIGYLEAQGLISPAA